MDFDTSLTYLASLSKSLQHLSNNCIHFDNSILITGNLYVSVDSAESIHYVLNEKLYRNEENQVNYFSNSFPALYTKQDDIYKGESESKDVTASQLQPGVAPLHTTDTDTQVDKSAMKLSTQTHFNSENACKQSKTDKKTGKETDTKEDKSLCGNPCAHCTEEKQQDVEETKEDFSFEMTEDAESTDLQSATSKEGQKKRGRRKRSQPIRISPLQEGEVPHEKKKRRKRGTRIPGEKPFVCDVCGKAFAVSLTLEIHKRTHTGERPFECEICGKTFTQQSSLNFHKKQHTGEKPFVCDVCGKGFTQKGNLKVHAKIHTDEKPYKCGECGKAFNTTQSLRRHTVLHTGQKPFKCEVCGFAFAFTASLNKHMMVHSGEKPHVCDECGAAYARKAKLREHKKKHEKQRMSEEASPRPPGQATVHREPPMPKPRPVETNPGLQVPINLHREFQFPKNFNGESSSPQRSEAQFQFSKSYNTAESNSPRTDMHEFQFSKTYVEESSSPRADAHPSLLPNSKPQGTDSGLRTQVQSNLFPERPIAQPHIAEFPSMRVSSVAQGHLAGQVSHFSPLFPPYYYGSVE